MPKKISGGLRPPNPPLGASPPNPLRGLRPQTPATAQSAPATAQSPHSRYERPLQIVLPPRHNPRYAPEINTWHLLDNYPFTEL